MPWVTNNTSVRLAAVLILGGLGLSACATTDYVDEHIAAVNARVDTVDAKASDAIRRADAAAAAAQTAEATAQAAATDARTANQRIDELTGRVGSLEQRAAAKAPRN